MLEISEVMCYNTEVKILAIESSCDETAAAIISGDLSSKNGKAELLSNVVVSQIDIFKSYGGVIPEVAARSHLEAILPVIHQAFSEAGPRRLEPDRRYCCNSYSRTARFPTHRDLDCQDSCNSP